MTFADIPIGVRFLHKQGKDWFFARKISKTEARYETPEGDQYGIVEFPKNLLVRQDEVITQK